jgi:predicted nuclease of predicted toxin-antitoxin system
VKLLFDQNLSHRLLSTLQKDYPESQHVRNVGLGEASDDVVWQYAAQHGLTILTKDADFHQRSFLFGYPPKVIWIRCGNCSTITIEQLLRSHREDIARFVGDQESAFLVIG